MKVFFRAVQTPNENQIAEYQEQLHVSPAIARLFISRGFSLSEAREFLNPGVDGLLDPFMFQNMEQVTKRIDLALERKEKITVYADYDCDGTCGAAILYLFLKEMGAQVRVYQPDRFLEGYGTNGAAVQRLIAEGTQLLITVDCGIRSVEDVALAKMLGVDTIILDHHECGELPDTPYILNPKLPGEEYPNRELCGAGVAFQLAFAMLGKKAYALIDLAGVATIGDIVSLRGENRALAALGIRKLRKQPAAGFQALAQAASLDLKKIASYGVSFILVPRINAAGRMEHARAALSLLTAKTMEEAREPALHLDALNRTRQERQKKIIGEAVEMVRRDVNLSQRRTIMLAGEGWDKGVVGLAASAIAERFCRPTVIFSREGDMLTGSARSIPPVNLYEILASQEREYIKFGGHSQAAGLSMQAEKLPKVWEAVDAFCREKYAESDFIPQAVCDLELRPEEIDLDFAAQLELLEPFGMGNESPIFYLPEVQIESVSSLGKTGEHQKFSVDGSGAEFLRFRSTEHLQPGLAYDLLGSVSVNEFRGRKKAQMIVRQMEEEEKRLGKDDIAENQRLYMRDFLREISGLRLFLQNPGDYRVIKDRDSLAAELGERGKQSLFGTAVLANMPWAAREILEIAPELAELFQIKRRGALEDSAINFMSLCPHGADLHNYNHVYLAGCFSYLEKIPREACTVYFPEGMLAAYQREIHEYFAGEEEMEAYREAVERACRKLGRRGVDKMSDFLRLACGEMPDASEKKMWFCLHVFSQQALLELKKSDKIHINYQKGSIQAENSRIFTAAREIMEKGGGSHDGIL